MNKLRKFVGQPETGVLKGKESTELISINGLFTMIRESER
jgi:hypothetical protein